MQLGFSCYIFLGTKTTSLLNFMSLHEHSTMYHEIKTVESENVFMLCFEMADTNQSNVTKYFPTVEKNIRKNDSLYFLIFFEKGKKFNAFKVMVRI